MCTFNPNYNCKNLIITKMRKITFLVGILLLVATIVSCDKKIIEKRISLEPSVEGVTPIYNPEFVNMSCDDLTGGPYTGGSSGKVNYNAETGDFDNNGAWPYGLVVTVSEDKYVEFHFPEGAQTQYCVGAVIVKGGPGANVYYYDPGVRSDAGLASPINPSGSPADLSNLTFCFVECTEPEEIVIALKSFYWPGPKSWMNSTWATSSGTMAFTPILPYDWCNQLGINYYPNTSSLTLLSKTTLTNVGTVSITENYTDGAHSFIVTITYLDGYTIDKSYLFVGSEEELEATVLASGCPDYTSWMLQDEPDNSNVQVIIIPL